MNTTAAAINRKIDAINRKANPAPLRAATHLLKFKMGDVQFMNSLHCLRYSVFDRKRGVKLDDLREGSKYELARFDDLAEAKDYAQRFAAAHPKVRVIIGGALSDPVRSRNPTPKRNPAGGVLLGIGVDAGKDRNGNPRRGHLVVRVSEGRAGIERVGFVESGYSGDSDLRRQFGDIPTIESFDVSSAVFKSLMSGRGL